MINLIIVGSSPIGKFMVEHILKAKEAFPCLIVGYIDNDGPSEFYKGFQIRYLGRYNEVAISSESKYLIAVENISLRLKLVEVISGAGGSFFSFIHPTSFLGKHVTKGEGVFIGPYCFVGDHCHVGSFSILKSKNILKKNVSIGLFCFLREHVVLEDGVSLGDGNYLGASSVIKSSQANHYLHYGRLEKVDSINFKSGQIPWFGLN